MVFCCLDTEEERSTFIEKVYPELRTHCRQHGFELQIHDLHWGLKDDSTEDHSLPSMCLNYLRNCQTSPSGGIVVVSLIPIFLNVTVFIPYVLAMIKAPLPFDTLIIVHLKEM